MAPSKASLARLGEIADDPVPSLSKISTILAHGNT